MQQIRSKRFENFIHEYSMNIRFGEEGYALLNLSDTGTKIANKNLHLNVSDTSRLQILSNSGNIVFDCDAKVIWTASESNELVYGVEFIGKMLPRELLHSIDQLAMIEYQIEKELHEFDEIPKDFRFLVYEIENFFIHLKKHIDAVELSYETQNSESKESLLAAVDIRFGDYVAEKLNAFGSQLFEYLDHLKDQTIRERYLSFFRRELNDFYLQSPYARRAMERPLGYAGDYEMMNQVYRNGYEGQTLFAKLIHRYTVNEAAAVSVRERKKFLAKEISEAIKTSSNQTVSIVSIACGPAQEWGDFLRSYSLPSDKSLEIVFVDQDIEALLEARRNVNTALCETSYAERVSVVCEPVAVKDILENTDAAQRVLGRTFDLVYSAGLYDYLPKTIAQGLTKTLSHCIQLKGKLLIGNFHPSSPTRAICEFSIDWHLIYRTQEELLELAEGISNINVDTEIDSQGIVVYLKISK